MFQCKGEHKRLYREKWEYYGGKADAKVYAAKPFDLKVLKNDLQMYINSDEDIIELEKKVVYYETIVEFIDGVIKSIDNRGWDIRNAQDWKNSWPEILMLTKIAKEVLEDVSYWIGYYENVISDEDISEILSYPWSWNASTYSNHKQKTQNSEERVKMDEVWVREENRPYPKLRSLF